MISIFLGWLDYLICRLLKKEREDVRDWATYGKGRKYFKDEDL
jgi:hypothetical protein